jgi:lipoprotein-anchoring transpeptidase ErfK/SrfK
MAAANNPAFRPGLRLNSGGPAVLRLQILLDRAHFSVGEIDGSIGRNTESALAGFRKQHGLPPGSGVDQPAWRALNEEPAPVLITYAITPADLMGPFIKVPADMMEQAKLDHLGYASPLDELAERFHISPVLLRKLNPGKQFMRPDEEILVPNVPADFTGHASKIVVSKSANTIAALDDQGRILAQYPCSSGSEHDPLPIGEWKVNGVAKDPAFHYNPDLFWDAKPEDAKATIAPGPRNPVGVVWIALSKEHYGIHGTPDPALVGHAQSHGCIRLTNWDALQLASLIKPGTPVSLVE